jgi:hypothetical protein
MLPSIAGIRDPRVRRALRRFSRFVRLVGFAFEPNPCGSAISPTPSFSAPSGGPTEREHSASLRGEPLERSFGVELYDEMFADQLERGR